MVKNKDRGDVGKDPRSGKFSNLVWEDHDLQD